MGEGILDFFIAAMPFFLSFIFLCCGIPLICFCDNQGDEGCSSETKSEEGVGAQVPEPTGESASTNVEANSSRSPASAETEGRPDPILPFQAEMLEARERLQRFDQIADRLSSGRASEEEQEELASGELERFVTETGTRFQRAHALQEAYWENQRQESARQDASFEREMSAIQARVDALERENQRLKRLGRGAGR